MLIHSQTKATNQTELTTNKFDYNVESFADLQILRYQVPGFEELSLNQKILLYYLSQAALEGRDILFDQNGKYNLAIRRTLEAVYQHYAEDKTSTDFQNLEIYLKRVWFSNGIHHHYSTDKFLPNFSEDFFRKSVKSIDSSLLPLENNQTVDELLNKIIPAMFVPEYHTKRVNQADGEDLIATSANNFYANVTQHEVETFYGNLKNPADSSPISYGLNSRLVKENDVIKEKVWKIGGLYSDAIEKIVFWLEKAKEYAENEQQQKVIETLITYYYTGNLKDFDEYSILWVHDTNSQVDFINGFIETYGDPLGLKGSWESLVNFKNTEATKRTEIISANAQWFEDHSPVDKRFKKEKVKGVSAKVITAVMLAGDCYPATPIGINLPNANWIRAQHGSKSVTIENITDAYDKAAQGNGFAQEFYWSEEEIELIEKYGFITDNMHTDLHECLGHGSGKLLPGVEDALKAYGATIEETRADLFGLYYIADKKMIELGLLPNDYAYKAEYYKFMTNGLMTQLVRIEPGNQIEESHMRNRQLIAGWVLEKGQNDRVVELKKRENKTFVVINDYNKLRLLFGELLAEIQRIRSEGDFEAAKAIVEKYAILVNKELHNEVLERYKKLNIAPYKGFVNPVYEVKTDTSGAIIDVIPTYNEGYAEQMLRYSTGHSWLPTWNN